MMTPSVVVPPAPQAPTTAAATNITPTAATSALSIDQLKQELLHAVSNADCDSAMRVIDEMAKLCLNRELLESTRVGALVNELRKKEGDNWPIFNKKCRALIKSWQKIAEVARPASSCNSSSNNGTPNLVSPATFSRKVTPCTPLNRLVTSTGLSGNKSATVSPASGSYAPTSKKEQVSPLSASSTSTSTGNHLHKSQSVGVDLLSKGDDSASSGGSSQSGTLHRNGKRKLDTLSPANSAANSPFKRTRTAAGSLASPATPSSVSDARKAVQSTSELVAQLSMGLPQHMNIDSTIRQHEEKVKREHLDEEYAMQLSSSSATGSPYMLPERKKRKYERKQKPVDMTAVPATAAVTEERRGGLILRLSRSSKGDASPLIIKPDVTTDSRESTPLRTASPSGPTTKLTEKPAMNGDVIKTKPLKKIEEEPEELVEKWEDKKERGRDAEAEGGTETGIDWMAQLPSLEELRIRAEEDKQKRENGRRQLESTKVYLMRVHSRDVLALPYLEASGETPDFVRFKYPNANQYVFDDIPDMKKE